MYIIYKHNNNISTIMKTGLLLVPRSQSDANEISKMLEETLLYAEWDVRNGHFYFPEKEDTYDELEKEIVEALNPLDLRYRIEGIF